MYMYICIYIYTHILIRTKKELFENTLQFAKLVAENRDTLVHTVELVP